MTIGNYLVERRFSPGFRDNYLIPMAAAIWSSPAHTLMDYPAESFIRFCGNHGLLKLVGRPLWRTVAQQFKSPLIYILFVAAVIAVALWQSSRSGVNVGRFRHVATGLADVEMREIRAVTGPVFRLRHVQRERWAIGVRRFRWFGHPCAFPSRGTGSRRCNHCLNTYFYFNVVKRSSASRSVPLNRNRRADRG